MNVIFEFSPGDTVTLEAVNCPARVRACSVDEGGVHEYRVTFWLHSERKTVWVTQDELKRKRDERDKSGSGVGLARSDP